MANIIKYIPPQLDDLTSTTTEASRKNPFRLLVHDVGVLLTNLRYLPRVIIPFLTSDPGAELYFSLKGARDTILQIFLFVFQACILVLAIPAFLVIPGTFLVTIAILCHLTIFIALWPMHGSRLAYSRMDERTAAEAKKHKTERWVFVNGCITSHRGMQENIDRISKTFGRTVIGVHNKTYGLIGDLIECLIQRCFAYSTRDVRVTYDYAKACLADPAVTKVILIGHSQGGIIVSLVLDYLFADIPSNLMSKLEIYTFGCAASHFNNPRSIRHIEHYCNEYDMITRWGALHHTMNVLDNRYSGTLFVRMAATGHMFNQHYMDPIFPLPSSEADAVEAVPGGNIRTTCFLDKVVNVDEDTAARRISVALRKTGIMRHKSSSGPLELGHDLEIILDGENEAGEISLGSGEMGGLGVGREARGRTVRQLSRLWRYLGGATPEEGR